MFLIVFVSCFTNRGSKDEAADLCEQHEGIVRSQVLLQELHTVSLQGGDSVLLGCVQRSHHSLRPDLDFIRVQKPAGKSQTWESSRSCSLSEEM